MIFRTLLMEMQYNDIVCKCNQVKAHELLEIAKFNPNASIKDILKKAKVGVSCGRCLQFSATPTKFFDIHYSKVLRLK